MVKTALIGKNAYVIRLVSEAAGPGEDEEEAGTSPVSGEDWDKFAKALGFRSLRDTKEK